MSDMSTLTTIWTVSPGLHPCSLSISATPPGNNRLNVSPCSSRFTMASYRLRKRRSEFCPPLLASSAMRMNSFSTASAAADGVVRWAAAMALIGRPSATSLSSSSSAGLELALAGDGMDHGVHDGRVEHRPAAGHRPHRPGQLVTLGHPVLQQVGVTGRPLGQQRDGVLGVVELGKHHDAGPRVALADLVRGLDALLVERGRHPDVRHHDLGRQFRGS